MKLEPDPFEEILNKLAQYGKCREFPEKAGCPHRPLGKGLCSIHFGRYCKALAEKTRKT